MATTLQRKIVSIVSIIVLLANLLPPFASSARAHAGHTSSPRASFDELGLSSQTSRRMQPLPGWFTAQSAANLSPLPVALPLSGPAADLERARLPKPEASSDHLPGWFTPSPASAASAAGETLLSPSARPLSRDIPEGLLTINLTGQPVASLGSPAGLGELYTAVIRNNSTDTAHDIYLTAQHPSFFIHDGGDQIISPTGNIPFAMVASSPVITWTPVPSYSLAPGQVITLTFRLRATCDAQSGQQMRVGVHYNADPGQPPVEENTAGLNITTGRGNLVIKKEPALQNLGTPDFGEPITWTVTVQNTGLGVMYNAVITDQGGISLSQPSGDLVPSVTIPDLQVNEIQTFTVVGTVEACNFTNVAEGIWPCGNLVGDATVTNPVQSTASVLFHPQLPNVQVQVASPFTFSYCTPVTRTVAITINNTGGPAANFRLDSTFESDSFLEVIAASLSSGWHYTPATGVFGFTGGSPAGTLPDASGNYPITLTFQIHPQALSVCSEGQGDVAFTPLYNDICSSEPFTASPVSLVYQYAQGEEPRLEISKSGPGVVASGESFTYQVTLVGHNPHNISGTVLLTDLLPSEFTLLGPPTASTGVALTNGQTITWQFDPAGTPNPFSETLIYTVQAITHTGGLCGASYIVNNDVQALARPTCPGCGPLNPSTNVETAITNNEGVFPGHSTLGSLEACGTGLTVVNSYRITGSSVVTWTGAVFTEALGTAIGEGALPGPVHLSYQPGSLAVSVNGVDYTSALTPVTATGQLVIDLSPLATVTPTVPTQNLTLLITYTVEISEASLNGLVDQTFYDWSQLYLPNLSDVDGCAANQAFNQVLHLTIGRGDLSVDVSPRLLDRCQANPVVITVNDRTPGRLTDHVVVTYTASTAEIVSARNFTYTGGLSGLGAPTVVTNADIGGGLGMITFTFPPAADLIGNGQIRFEVDVNCTDRSDWQAGVAYETLCGISHTDLADRDHLYRAPNLILFATPIEYTVREKEVMWKFFVTNNGNLTATNVVVTNVLQGLAAQNYAADDPGVSIVGSLPITAPNPLLFTIDSLGPNQQRAVTVTARVISCDPLHVSIRARQDCFGTTCNQPQAEVNFDTPDPYLLTNNGETADLPMCDVGEVIFTTKNASSDVTLYQLNITETLIGLTPVPGAPITVTIVDDDHAVIASTTTFTPEITTPSPGQMQLTWRAISATTEVMTWFNALPPLYVVRIFVPVRTSCIPPNTPQSFASASALGPCNNQLGYTEDAVTLNTLQPDMDVSKAGRVAGGDFGETVYAAPGQTVTWRLQVYNHQSSRSYVAYNVVLSDTWPSNFEFITATQSYTPQISGQNTITWDIGDMPPQVDPLVFYITGTVAMTDDACSALTVNHTRLTFGCDNDGCTSDLVPQDTAQLESRPNLEVVVDPTPLETCSGAVPVTIRNYGAPAYSSTLTVTVPLPGYEIYSYTVTSGPAPTTVASLPAASPWFYWDLIPGQTSAGPFEMQLLMYIRNSASAGLCPVADGQPVVATIGYDNHAVCTLTGPFSNTDTANLDVRTPSLNVTKSPRTQVVDVGETITWTLTVVNTGNGIAENVRVTDVVGSNYHSVTATVGSDGAVPQVNGDTITWTLAGPLAASGGTWTASVSAILSDTGHNRNIVTATAHCATGCETASASDVAYATLLQTFEKNPPVQTGTIGSLVVFTFTSSLPDVDALYEDLTLVDDLPDGLTYLSSILTYTYDDDGNSGGPFTVISTTPTSTPDPVVWELGDLPGTASVTGIVTAVIADVPAANAGARLVNDLRMTYTDDGQPYAYTDTADVDVLEPELALVKASAPPTSNAVGAGDFVTYTVTINNWNDPFASPASDVVLTDTLPEGMRDAAPLLIAVTVDGAPVPPADYVTNYAPASGLWTVTFAPDFTIPVGGELVVRYVATVDNDIGANLDLTNHAQVTWSSLPGAVSGERHYGPIDDDTTVHTTLPTLGKLGEPLTATLGSVITYTILAPQPPITATLYNVTVTDQLDPRLQLHSVTDGPDGTVTVAGNAFTVTYPSIAHDTQRRITVTAVLSDPLGAAAGDLVSNRATLSHATGVTESHPTTFTVTEPNLTLVKASAPPTSNTVGAGDLVTYTVSITNASGPDVSPAYDVLVTDTLPAHVTLFAPIPVSVELDGAPLSAPADYIITYASGLLILDLTDTLGLPPGRVLTLVYHGRVDANVPAGEDQINDVQASWSSLPGAVPGDRDYGPISDTTAVHAGYPVLELVKNGATPTVEAGDRLTYTLHVTNSGLVSATGVVVTDATPAHTFYLACGPAPCSEAGDVVSWTLGTLDVGASRSLTMVVQVNDPLLTGTLIANTAWVTSAEGVTDTGTLTTPVTSRHALTLTKSASPATVDAGDLLTYTLAWSVGGNEPALNVTVSDTTPAHTTFWSASPAPIQDPGLGGSGPVVWSLGTVSPPANGLVTLTVRVDSPLVSGTLLYNAAILTDSQGLTDTGDVTTPIQADHNINLVKSADPAPVPAGELLTYTLAWSVTGLEPAPDLTISDTTPAHTTFWSASPAPIQDPGLGGSGPVVWSLGTVSPPANGLVTLTVRVDSPLVSGTLLYNAATITDSEGLTDTGDVTTSVESWHTLTLTKRASPSPAQAGSPMTYTLDWSVSGNEIARNVTIHDPVPANTTYQNCLGGLSCGENLNVVTWELGDLYPPQTGILTGAVSMVVLVNTPLYSGTVLHNAALVTDSQGLTDTGEVTTPIQSDHALAVTKTASPSPVAAGGTLTYTLHWSVSGNEPAPDVTLSDPVPSNTVYQTCNPAPCGEGAGVVTWTLGTLNPGDNGAVAFVVTVDPGLPDGAVLTNSVSITDSQGVTDSDEITTLVQRANVAVTKHVTPALVASGDRMTFTLLYTSDGPAPAKDVVIVDVLPDGLTYAGAIPTPTLVSGQTITWRLGTLNAGVTGLLQLWATMDMTTTTHAVLTNTVRITTATPQTNTDDDEDDKPVQLEQTADVSVVKRGQPPAVVSGDRITYSLTYANAGPADAANVLVTDSLPSGLGFSGCAPGSCGVAGQVVTWSLGTVPAGAAGVLTLYATVDVTGNLSAVFTNTVVVTTTTDDRNPDNNDDDETTPLTQTVGLEVIKTVLPQIGVNGQTLTYSVRLRNTGDVPLNPVRLDDRLPDGFLYNNHALVYPPPNGAPLEPDAVAEPDLVWNDVTSGAGLPAGQSMTLTYRVTVATGVTGTFINVVTATGHTPTEIITDTDEAPIPIEDPAIRIDKQLSGHDSNAGVLTFTIYITNVGPSVVDVLPLLDAYDPQYLGFVDAVPYPEEDADDGLLSWYDLTGPPPHGFDQDLSPNERVVITTVFTIVQDITMTVNSVTVTDAIDEHDNTAEDDEDEEEIINVPTSVELLYLRASAQEHGVLVEWATAVEIDSYGFKLYRATVGRFAQAVQIAFQASQGHQELTKYNYMDREAAPQIQYWYWLVEVDNTGLETRYGPVSTSPHEPDDLGQRIYLPLVLKQ